ncbi:FERM, ARHGEF and pleckstrin domain-containing protein 2 isoform X1 [Eurytemora carolleeae]|uniref:FERM, ARHGEF and pleckstrin domain-containing protein 2 isoform X1 n=2 Tax=Eurytemora carolleeae TaxID=1294199 RepID=UPI000C76E212|nr:FERM, ARHGEF and pleckstrin domain-containing protein 2 isoform X1 [Eurytemora carolleeae]XP_023319954.1 FERM, ARHGEF and pleckstrin domain-containing protein 2 isoform X1 [Eurytemora carolleeae]|eukprot:XP_023319872.1 FERM, ARHGEF and pleckstrin domain-containing protein 2-like isoform X1 [Eurytemora affinis]
MRRQNSIHPDLPPSSPVRETKRGSSEGDATMISLTGSLSQPTTSTSTPVHSSFPTSPFRLMREESVDGTLSPVSMKGTMDYLDNDLGTAKRKRLMMDKAYFISKELLMTERTYKKDLEIINLWWRDELSSEENMPEETVNLLFSHIDPLYELHAAFLKDIETRMASWENKTELNENRKIGDLVLKHMNQGTMEHYYRYIDTHVLILENLEQALHRNNKFEQVYRDFEMQKVCYLPITTLLLKPVHRVLHYQLILERLLNHYGGSNPDYPDANMALSKVRTVIKKLSSKLKESENLVKLMELQRDLVGYDNLVQEGREFVREGCLQKLSRKGYQQRMFFLFSDMLLYANRTTSPGLQFRVHGQLSVPDLQVVESEPRMGADFCFNVYDGKRALMVAASSQTEKLQWMEDIVETVQFARERGLDSPTNKYLSLKSMSGSDDGLDRSEVGDLRHLEARPAGQRSNSSVHVCWHRATSVAIMDHQRALENQLSGYLLRKFKNSNGWQKLWVVFTNFCLYFYKTFQDDFPLASLPLLGYSVDTPDTEDNIQKDFVFKLQFKNHVYFFRAESQYTFDRWLEVLSTATRSPLTSTSISNGVH